MRIMPLFRVRGSLSKTDRRHEVHLVCHHTCLKSVSALESAPLQNTAHRVCNTHVDMYTFCFVVDHVFKTKKIILVKIHHTEIPAILATLVTGMYIH